jgi:Ca-activated chloride channel homolog
MSNWPFLRDFTQTGGGADNRAVKAHPGSGFRNSEREVAEMMCGKKGVRPGRTQTGRRWSWFGALAVIIGCLALVALKPLTHEMKPGKRGSDDQTLSPYFVVLGADSATDALPLKSTGAQVKIAGKVAEVTVTQVYKNQGQKTLEAIYVFPASTRAAVHAMRMTIGERVIEADVMERRQARQTYEDAKKAGKTTSLLEQQRPNVFQMNVANILPGDEVKVELKYVEVLQAEDKVYEFIYPAVVGPRYSNQPADGAPDTEKWVANPYLHEGQPPPYTFGITVDVRGGLPLAKLASPSHEVKVKYDNPQTAQVTLVDDQTGGNRDFVLRYALAGDKIDAGLLLYPGQDENFFLMVMEPPERVKSEAAVPREYIFIVDVSGSMHGFPLDTAKALMKDIITKLRPQDAMNVLLFAGASTALSESGSLPATEDNKKKALEFIMAQPGGGGTEIVPAFKHALALPRTEGASRIVVAATDGYVHVETELFDLIRKNLGNANLFPFGIGTSVNRFLIEGMARAGKGEPFVVLNQGEAAKQAARFQRYIETPILTGIKATFPGFESYEVEPLALPDLFAERPLTLLGKYKGAPQGAIVITGKTAQGDFRREIKVEPAQASPDNAALRFLWARERIHRLSDDQQLSRGKDEAMIKEITDLGLKYHLMTAYTSFVAVDKVKRADGTVTTVKQPLPLPEGVSDLAVGDGRRKAMMGMLASPHPGYGGRLAMNGKAPQEYASGLSPAKTSKEQPGKPSTPALKVQATLVKGEVDIKAVQQVLTDELARLEKCCQDVMAKGGKLPRAIPLVMTLGPDGKVTQAGQLTRIKLPGNLAACLVEALKQMAFPKPVKGSAEVKVMLLPGDA